MKDYQTIDLGYCSKEVQKPKTSQVMSFINKIQLFFDEPVTQSNA